MIAKVFVQIDSNRWRGHWNIKAAPAFRRLAEGFMSCAMSYQATCIMRDGMSDDNEIEKIWVEEDADE